MPVPFAEQEKSKDMAFPKKLEQGEVIPVVSAEKTQGFTSPPKAFTEDTLLSAMESAGNKEFEKDTEKKGTGRNKARRLHAGHRWIAGTNAGRPPANSDRTGITYL